MKRNTSRSERASDRVLSSWFDNRSVGVRGKTASSRRQVCGAERWLSVIPIKPNTYILKFMIKSQTCWFVRGHSYGAIRWDTAPMKHMVEGTKQIRHPPGYCGPSDEAHNHISGRVLAGVLVSMDERRRGKSRSAVVDSVGHWCEPSMVQGHHGGMYVVLWMRVQHASVSTYSRSA